MSYSFVQTRRGLAPWLALLALPVAGCGASADDGLPREAVSGAVSIDGKPVKAGLITFLPDAPGVTTQGGGAVIDGKYAIPRAQGLVPGKYKVMISSPDDSPERKESEALSNNAPGMAPVRAKEAVPSAYNSKSILTADVKPGGPNVFEFSLSSMPAK